MNEQPEFDPNFLTAVRTNYEQTNDILDSFVRVFQQELASGSNMLTEMARFIRESLYMTWKDPAVMNSPTIMVGEANRKDIERVVAVLAAAIARLSQLDVPRADDHLPLGEAAATAYIDQASTAARNDINNFANEYAEHLRNGETPDSLVRSLMVHALQDPDLSRPHMALLQAQAIRMLAEQRAANGVDTP